MTFRQPGGLLVSSLTYVRINSVFPFSPFIIFEKYDSESG